jgi:ATP-dependent RNA helicase HelY
VTELSAAERYAASKSRVNHPLVADFRANRTFDLDPFQIAACESIEDGRSVLVAAPTGAGKTVVAEFSVYLTMKATQSKIFYTTPIKALSNQKFNELCDEWGEDNVGLLTGDTNINGNARIVVMTTEVLRNMLYAESTSIDTLEFVVMDEVHYLADRFRGAVWEEVIIHLPRRVRMISLSATVSNAEEFGDWLQAVRGDTDVIVSEDRPVPLDQHVLVGSKMIDLFDGGSRSSTPRVNPELVQLANASSRSPHYRGGAGRGSGRNSRVDTRAQGRNHENKMHRSDIVDMLGQQNLLPCIFFIFSRAGCDQAVQQVLRSGLRLTSSEEREEIREIVDERCRTLLDEDLAVLGYWEWVDGLERGVAAHHAGLLPAFKEVVEELFQRRLLRVVFATETLALGVNMPARTVVLERLDKFNGEGRVPLSPGEYTQLTGRAGRRGIDVEGHSLIQWSNALDPQTVSNLASRRTYPLNSSFKPTYNMAINLVTRFGRQRTREILESSFAQFQADRAVVDLARKVKQQEESLEGYAEPMSCHLGDFAEYSTFRRKLTDLERDSKNLDSLPRAQRDKRAAELARLRKSLKSHPCHSCPEREDHARWAERWWRLKRDTDKLVQQINTRTGAVARIFDRVCDVLLELDYLTRDSAGNLKPTINGSTLGRIYGDRDLLVAEALRRGLWDELDAPSLAAIACCIVFEPRREEGTISERMLPRGKFREALDATTDLWAILDDLEHDNKLPGTSQVSPGLALAMYKWAQGKRLDDVLFDADMPAGDFVRWTKQTIDLLDQLSVVAQGNVSLNARKALDGIRRGVVAYSGVL